MAEKILVVDDEELILKALRRELRQEGYEIETFDDPVAALKYLQSHSIDLIISDYRMPHMDGVEFLSQARKLQPENMRIIVSGNADLQFLQDAINKAEIYRFLAKPWDRYELLSNIRIALEFRRLQKENSRLADKIRNQSNRLKKQQAELARLEEKHPGITKVDFDQDGAIVLDDVES